MKPNRRPTQISQSEKELYERVFLQEVEMQLWFAIGYSEMLEQEVFLVIQ
jgi:hypothetical protein